MGSLKLFRRAFVDLFQLGKGYFLYLFLHSLASKSVPFIGFIYMTRIVDALTNDQLERITTYITQYLILLLILQVIAGMTQPKMEDEESILIRKIYAKPHKKMLKMHYHRAESSKVREKLEMIDRKNMNSQSSLPMLQQRLETIIPQSITLIWGIILLYPLFGVNTSQLPEGYRWLHPVLILIIFLGLLLISVFLQMKTSEKSAEVIANVQTDALKWNALFNYEREMLEDPKSGKELRLYHLTKKMIENQDKQQKILRDIVVEMYKNFRNLTLPTTGLFQVLNYFIYAYLGILVLIGALPVALIIQLSSALSQMVSALPEFIQVTMMMISTPKDLEEYYEFMDLPDEENVGSLPIEKRLDNDYEISLIDLSFAYPDSENVVLKNLSESFEIGKKYAIVGENGSGKTTFIKLLTRLYEPSKGKIKLNRIDSDKYDLKEYFNLFGVVFQDYHLLGFSIGQNISVSPNYDQEKVMSTLNKVGLGNFVRGLPSQADTYLGTEFDDTGVNVSGGQGQKIAIARSLYKDAPIMILDEPTAALDPITEFEIYQNFDRLVEDKTAFYISHRLSSSKFCDEILVFDKGEIIQRGTHEELVNIEGKYQELWNAQAQYYQ
jgi:ATP-binding cassette subfamily B protein